MRRSFAFLALALCVLLPRAARAQDNPFSSCTEPTSQSGFELETIDNPTPGGERMLRARFRGSVVIPCGDLLLLADEVTYDSLSQEVHAIGNVVLQQPDLTIYAERAVLNRTTRLGTFYVASGWARIGETPNARSSFGTMEQDVLFHGEEIAKIGPKTYRIRGGGFTSCVQATPRWEMTSSESTITLDKYALLKNVVLRVKDVPLLYLPAIYYPINKEDRATGFLLPQYGSSTYQGTSLSNAFFLVLGRSQDATFYHDFYSKSGQGLGVDYRYVSGPTGSGNARFYMLNEKAQVEPGSDVITRAPRRSFQIDGDANQGLPHRFRAYGRVKYFTDAETQQLYQDIGNFSERRRSFAGTVTGSLGRYRITGLVNQSDLFYGSSQGQRWGQAPSLTLNVAEMPIGRSKVYTGGSAEGTYLVRQDDITRPETNRSLWRFNGGPTVRAPLSTLPFLTATGQASWQLTRWQESLDPVTGEQVPIVLTRQRLELRGQVVGPVLSRVFLTPNNGYADGFKHVIEPRVTVLRTFSAFEGYDRTVVLDSVDTLVPDVTSVDYRLTNRLLARRRRSPALPGGVAAPGAAREILSVEIGQTYYTNSLAASVDPQYQNDGITTRKPTNFSAIRIAATSQPFDATSAEFQMEIDPTARAIKTLRASGSVGAERLQLSAGWSKRLVIPGLPGFENSVHYLNASTTVRTLDNRLGGTYAFDLDIANRTWVQQRIMASYNSQCCGVSFDWQSVSAPYLPTGRDRRFGLSFSLAGIGSFSNPLGSFGGQ